MNNAAIRAEALAKRHRVGHRERYVTLRGVLANFAKRGFSGRNRDEEFVWAVRNVSFEVAQGEVVGLIGRNGAGKTTLLKLLARITMPTSGCAEIRGRVGSLLEVGTGFHPELSGRENVFLSGAILGMKKGEIRQKFDAIVAFAEVERFIDTPLKHYSTGMQMRLAFAVAAHLEPEILFVDEVLAVGDAEFQRKCLGKMHEVSEGGRTIVFISHQMSQVRRLCGRVIWLDGGQIRAEGPPGDVIAAYESASTGAAAQGADSLNGFLRWEIPGSQNVLRGGMEQVTLRFFLHMKERVHRGHFGLNLYNDAGVFVGGWGFDEVSIPEGLQKLDLALPLLPIKPGVYSIQCSLFNHGNNLNGGHLIESWNAVPSLIVDSAPLAHPQDRWTGLLNIPGRLLVSAAVEAEAESSDGDSLDACLGTRELEIAGSTGLAMDEIQQDCLAQHYQREVL